MVENMQERQRFLLEREEYRVNQLQILEVVVDHVVEFHSRCPRLLSTDGLENTPFPQNWQDLLRHENEQNETAAAENNVMYLEKSVEFLRGAIFHHGLDTKDSDEIRQ